MAFQTEKIGIVGVDEMARVLRMMPVYVANKVLAKALRKAAVPIAKAAAARAPRGAFPGGKVRRLKGGDLANYGQLYKNIRIKEIRDNDPLKSHVVVNTGKAFWGLFQEVPTNRPQKLQPFLGPAFDANKERALLILREELAKGIQDAARQLAGLPKAGLRFRGRR